MSNAARTQSIIDRITFLRIDEATKATLREFQPYLAQRIDQILEEFYGYLRAVPQVAPMLVNPAVTGRARDLQSSIGCATSSPAPSTRPTSIRS